MASDDIYRSFSYKIILAYIKKKKKEKKKYHNRMMKYIYIVSFRIVYIMKISS